MSGSLVESVVGESMVLTNHPLMAEPFGNELIKLAETDDRIVGLSADLAKYTDIHIFRDKYPDRFYNVGMSEQFMMCCAAGLAKEGFIPFATTYATFIARRCYDFISQAICENHVNVKIVGGLPGLQSGFGSSHQATDDLAILGSMPDLIVIDPADAVEMMQVTKAAAEHYGPVYLRLLRGKRVPIVLDKYNYQFEIGKAKMLREGSDILVISSGEMTVRALDAADELQEKGISVAVLHSPTIKPLDKETILNEMTKKPYKIVYSAENHSVINGLGSQIANAMIDNGVRCNFKKIALPDKFLDAGTLSRLQDKYGISEKAIKERILTDMGEA